MVPSNRWFPASLQDRAAWFDNFANNFSNVAVSLGFTLADSTEVAADNAAMQFIANTAVALEAYKDGIRGYRIALTEGNIGDPAPAFPANVTFTAPDPPRPAGLFERLDELVKRIRVSPAYTEEIGGLLGIIPTKPDDVAPENMQPVIKARAMPGSVVEVEFKRGMTDGISVQTMLDETNVWDDAGKFFKSPATLNIPPNGGGPRKVTLRARYLAGNNAVGLNSDQVVVVTTP